MTTLILQLVLAALLAAQSQAVPPIASTGNVAPYPGTSETTGMPEGADAHISTALQAIKENPRTDLRQLGGEGRATPDSGPDRSSDAESSIGQPAQAIKGNATWYDAPSIHDAAAGPALREAIGKHWRGTTVTVVTLSGHSVTVRLTDFCACGPRHGRPTLIDLDRDAFAELASPSRGVIAVTIEFGGDEPAPTLPPTDMAP